MENKQNSGEKLMRGRRMIDNDQDPFARMAYRLTMWQELGAVDLRKLSQYWIAQADNQISLIEGALKPLQDALDLVRKNRDNIVEEFQGRARNHENYIAAIFKTMNHLNTEMRRKDANIRKKEEKINELETQIQAQLEAQNEQR